MTLNYTELHGHQLATQADTEPCEVWADDFAVLTNASVVAFVRVCVCL